MQINFLKVIIFISVIFLGSCTTARHSTAVYSNYVNPDQYSSLSCNRLMFESQDWNRKEQQLISRVDRNYDNQVLAEQASWWLWAPAALDIDNERSARIENELANARGHIEAINSAIRSKNCLNK